VFTLSLRFEQGFFYYAYHTFSRNKAEKLRILWPTMRSATHFYPRSVRSVTHYDVTVLILGQTAVGIFQFGLELELILLLRQCSLLGFLWDFQRLVINYLHRGGNVFIGVCLLVSRIMLRL